MKNALPIIVLCLLAQIIVPQHSNAQMIWPGDINNNGVVNNIDFLHLGVAYGAVGPLRQGATTDWTPQAMGDAWTEAFPESTNFAYADANGDGQVDDTDISAGIKANMGATHGTITEDEYSSGGNPNLIPNLKAVASNEVVAGGTFVTVVLEFGEQELPITDFYGLAFSIEYDPAMVMSETFEAAFYANAWTNPGGFIETRTMVDSDVSVGTAQFAITRIDGENASGYGPIASFSFFVREDAPEQLFYLGLTNVKLMSNTMETLPLFAAGIKFTVSGATEIVDNCPNVISPVCGADGNTYLNSCVAEVSGVMDYTVGVCFGDCIDPAQIDPSIDCPSKFVPVCGCNGVTYLNECEAESFGIQSYVEGPCSLTDDCHDTDLIVGSSGTTVDNNTGIISLDCPTTNDPVCGCNGITYQNSCEAEASGITFYTAGTCSTSCVDPTMMDPSANCGNDYVPVCGCNNVTYTNACYADAAGVVNYSNGVCGSTSAWCAEAELIQCGDFLASETTVGTGNNISAYPGCEQGTFLGPDKVYVFNKTTAGDLQIGLEILTPNLDLDLFLLAPNCNQVTCIGKSTTSNTSTNNEGILLEDAPIGTYYIVVDAQFASAQGVFNLEVSCGYLSCTNAQALTCGVPFQFNNGLGSDDVSLYGCDNNIFNVENNGPEVVHTFTTTAAGEVDITLTGLSANLELFLLRSCDRGDCVTFSQNPGTSNEQINTVLPAGTYFVVVDGYNGAISDYTLEVDCNSSCNLNLSVSATAADCGQNNGVITVSSSGGTPAFVVFYNGPVSGNFSTISNNCTISNLPAGTYTITKVDVNGCSATTTVIVPSSGGLNFTATPTPAQCMEDGSIQILVTGGTSPYQVLLSGPVNGNVTVFNSSFTLQDLPGGAYTILIKDANDCTATRSVVIQEQDGGFDFVATPNNAECGDLGSISIATINGIAPYTVSVSGPVSGSATVGGPNFTINDLPAGVYTITVEDGNWCTHVETVTLNNLGLDVSATSITGACGAPGAIALVIGNGTPNYEISWTGPVSNSTITSNSNVVIPNLPSGVYNITVEDHNGCTDFLVVTVNQAGDELNIGVIPIVGDCGQDGALWIDIFNGTPAYTISWTGPESGSITINDSGTDIPNLTPGTYTVTIVDANGCSNSKTVLLNGGGNLHLDLNSVLGDCGIESAIEVLISGGAPNYIITWTGPTSGSTITSNDSYIIDNLAPGSYTVSVVDGNGCTNSESFFLNIGSNSNVEIVVNALNGLCDQPGALWVSVIGGDGPYTVTWESGIINGSVTFNSGGISIPNLPIGTYTVTVEDSNGCSDTEIATINSSQNGVNLVASPQGASCTTPGSIQLSLFNGTAPYFIQWTGPNSGSVNTNNNSFTINNLLSGTYTVTVVDENGCTDTESVFVSGFGNITIAATATDATCESLGSIQIAINGSSGPFTIVWNGPVAGTQTVNATTVNLNGLPAGTYSITVSDGSGCSDLAVVIISQQESTIVVTASTVEEDCVAEGSVVLDIDGGDAPYKVTWTGPESGTIFTNNSIVTIPNLDGGTYIFSVEDDNDCDDVVTVQLNAVENNLDVIGFTTNELCDASNSIQLNISGGTPNYVIQWSGPIGGSTVFNGSVFSLNDIPSGIYNFTVSDASGCSVTEQVTATVLANTLDINVSLIVNQCNVYNTIWVDVLGGTGPYIIQWTGPESGSVTDADGAFEIEDLNPGVYTIKVTDDNGCMIAKSITIFQSSSPIFSATPQGGLCGDPGNIYVDFIGGVGPFTLTYTGPVSSSLVVNGGAFFIQNLPSGIYTITVQDSNGCTDSEGVNLVNQENTLDLELNTSENDCSESGMIGVSATGGSGMLTLTWTGPQSGSTILIGGTFTLNNLPEGTYQFKVTDINGCSDTEFATVENITSNLDLIITPVPSVCGEKGSLWLDIFGGTMPYQILWTGPVSGSTTVNTDGFNIPNLPSGVYTVTIVDANGCSISEMATLINTGTPVNISVSATSGSCDQLGSATITISGGTPNYLISWMGPVSGNTTISNNVFTLNSLPGGTYQIAVTDSNGCIDTKQVFINSVSNTLSVITVPTDIVCLPNGTIHVGITGGTPNYTVTWTGPSSGSITIGGVNYTITGLDAGTYTVKVTDANGCMETNVVTIDAADVDLDINASLIINDCGVYNTIWIDIFGGTGPYVIVWTGPDSGTVTDADGAFEIEDLTPGDYIIKVTDANNCMETITITVYESNINLFDATPINGDCGELGNISITFLAGTFPYTVSIAGPVSGTSTVNSGTHTSASLPSGTYIVTVEDAAGCFDSETVVINNIENDLDLMLTTPENTCGSEGRIDIAISGGTSSYTINWTGPESGSTVINGFNFVLNDLATGTYTVAVIDANGCTTSESIFVESNPDDLELIVTPVPGVCGQNGSLWLDFIGGTMPYTVTWTGPSSGSTVVNNNGVNIPNLPSGTYTVTLVDANGCTVTEIGVLTNSNDNFDVVLTSTNGTCGGSGTINLTITGGTPNYTITWNGPVSGATTIGNNTFNLSNLPNGVYQFTITDAIGCVDTEIGQINSVDSDVDFIVVPTTAICDMGGKIHIGITSGTAPYTITWTGPISGSITTSGVAYNIQDTPPGTYTITVTDSNGCSETQTTVVENIDTDLEVSAALIINECGVYNTIWIDIFGGTGPYMITWTGPQSGTETNNNGAYEIIDLPPGEYVIKITDAINCMVFVTVTVFESQVDLFEVTPMNGDCGELGQATLTFTGTAPYIVNWTGPITGATTTSEATLVLTDLPSGTYNFSIQDGMGCFDSQTIVISNQESNIDISAVLPEMDCGEMGTISVSVSGGSPNYILTWTGPESGSTTFNGIGFDITGLPSGTYQLSVTDAENCTETENVVVNVVEDDLDLGTVITNSICDAPGSILVSFTGGTPNYLLEWSGPVSGTTSVSGSSFNIGNLPAGVYTISATGDAGCSDSETVVVSGIDGDINLNATVNNGNCGEDGSIVLGITGGTTPYTVSWTGPSSGNSSTTGNLTISNLTSGTYAVQVTDANGCEESETIVLSNTGSDVQALLSPVNGICGSDGSVFVGITGGVGPFQVLWTGPENGSDMAIASGYNIPNLSEGTYTITVIDANGCSTVSTTNVIVGADDLSVLFMNQNGACGQTGSIQIFISGGNPNYTITWNGPVSGSATTGSNFTISNLTNGTYSVIVADTNGCSETETITINNNANNLTVTSSVMNGVCGSNGSIQLDITGGTAPYTINWAGPISGSSSTNADEIILENFPTGTYTFTITDGSSCTTTTTATLVNPGDLDLIATAINGACGNLGSIKLDINNGTPAYTVSWQGPSSGNITTNSSQLTIPNLLAGTYTITVVDSNGCSDTASVSVVNTEDDLDVVFTPLNGACGDLGSVWIDILGGTSSYIITWTGPTSGSEVTHDNFYDIVDLPSGTYTITVLDANNCSETTVVTITNVVDDLVATFAPQAGSCGGPSSLQVSISGGTPEYTIAWNGGNSSGSLTTTETNVTIGDLTPGVYNVTVLDINGCQETGSFGLNNNGNNLVVNASPTPFNCGVFGFIDLSFVGGNPTYTITWTGPVAGSSTTSESTFRIDNLTMGAYMITVTDGFGCSRMQSVFVGEMTAAPVADFSASVTDLSVQLVNQSTSGTFTWDFGDGNNSTEPSLTHTYLSAGTYTICLTATNACGSDIHCETVTVAGNGDMVTLDVGERSGLQGATLQVPVVIENCDLMVSLSGSLALSNPSVANIVGVSGGVITPQFNLNNQTFNFYDNNGTGISLSDGDILFYLEVTLTGSAGQSTLIEITDSPLISEVGGYINSVPSSLPHLRIAGEVSVVQSGQLEGTAMTYYGTGIQSAEISMTGTDVDMLEMTDEGGYFRFPEMPVGGNYQLTAEKDMNAANGLSTYGLFIGQRFLLGIETPQITSPYQIIAADANCSNSFTTLDLFVIQQLIIGVNDAFDHCPSWVFVAEESYMPEEFDAYNVFPYAHHHEVSITDNMVKNFIGVKVGDILGHASPNMLHVEDIDDRSLELMRLQTADQTYETGELVELTFNTSDFKDIASYQMELLFDTEQLSYLGFEAPEDGPLASAIAGEAPTADGALRISWFDLMGDGINLEASAEVFTLRFKAEDKIEDLSSLFTLSSRGIRSEAHQPNGDPVKIVLEFVKDKVAVTGTGYQLHQNTPNPFTNETKIGFELPAAMDAELIIHDHLGRVVQRFEGYYDGGYNEVVWSKANLQSGVYYYTLKTADYAATLNMIILD